MKVVGASLEAGNVFGLPWAGLFTRSLSHVQQTNPGFDPSHVVNLMTDPAEIIF